MTLSATVADTSWCSRTVTGWVPSGLDRVAERDRATLVDLGPPATSASAPAIVGGGDRAEQPTGRAGPHLTLDRSGLELALDLVGVVRVADRAEPRGPS